jgi:hypothetical protein
VSTTATSYLYKINSLIDFPKPGVDNDSQGFRDQWANIKGAIDAVNDQVEYLDNYTIKTDGTGTFYGNTIRDVNLENFSTTLNKDYELQIGDIEVDYTKGGYHAFDVTPGTHNLNVINWPSVNAGRLTVTINPFDLTRATSITFPNSRFVSLDNTSTYALLGTNVFELFSEQGVTSRSPNYYIKNLGYKSTATTTWNVIGTNSNVYSMGSTNYETFVSNSNKSGAIGLLPDIIYKTVQTPPAPSATSFTLNSVTGILPGATFYVGTTTATQYTVISASTVSSAVLYNSVIVPTPASGDVVTFVNPRFTQNAVLNITATKPASSTSTIGELKGQVYIDSTTTFFTYADANLGTTNKIQISGDQSGAPRALGAGSTATTVALSNTSTAVATTEFVYNFVNSSTTVVSYANTSSYSTFATSSTIAKVASSATTLAVLHLTTSTPRTTYGSRTISYEVPSGGVDGDVWYQII